MKKFLLKPGFEFIFALSLTVILGLPPVLLAQAQKDTEIKIENGDTTINGKNIKELSQAERKSALQDINHIKGEPTITFEGRKDGDVRRKIIIRRDTAGGGKHRIEITRDLVTRDSLGNVVDVKPGKHGKEQRYSFSYRMNDESPDKMLLEGRDFGPPVRSSLMRFDRRNSQRFDYVSTDNEGISTHVSYRIGDATNDDLKKIPHVEGAKFEISDLTLVPEFTSGKTLLMFSLPSKSPAEVKLTDSEGKVMWTEKVTGGNFNKAFALGLNGIYYLQIKQGNGVAVKRIVKDE